MLRPMEPINIKKRFDLVLSVMNPTKELLIVKPITNAETIKPISKPVAFMFCRLIIGIKNPKKKNPKLFRIAIFIIILNVTITTMNIHYRNDGYLKKYGSDNSIKSNISYVLSTLFGGQIRLFMMITIVTIQFILLLCSILLGIAPVVVIIWILWIIYTIIQKKKDSM